MKNKEKLAFELLEQEMKTLNREEQRMVFGGWGYSSGVYVFSNCNNYNISSDCVFQCMAQVGDLYGNSNLSFSSMMNNYDTLYASAISSGDICSSGYGVNSGVFTHFVDQYYNRAYVSTYDQLDGFIQQGGDNFAIGVIEKVSSSGMVFYHAVVLTGMTGDCTKYTYLIF